MPNTKKAKRAQLVVSAVAVVCPHCATPIGDPSTGSDIWEPQQIQALLGTTVDCITCGGKVYLPTVVASVRML